MEQIDFNLLFRWFVGLELDEAASIKSFMRKDAESGEGANSDEQQLEDQGRNKEVNFHGEQFSNVTHQSVTDGEARLYRKAKGKEARLSFMGHLLTENRNGLIVQASVSQATGTAEREVALAMLDAEQSLGRRTLGADKNYDTKAFVADCRERKVTPHVAQKKHTAIDGRTTRHAGYEISIRKRKQIEECFGWMKDIGLMRKLRHRGQSLVNQLFLFTAAAYNLVRMRRLLA